MLRFRKLVCFRSPRNIAQAQPLSLIEILQKETYFLQINFERSGLKNLASFYDVLGLKIYDANSVVMVL